MEQREVSDTSTKSDNNLIILHLALPLNLVSQRSHLMGETTLATSSMSDQDMAVFASKQNATT